DRIVVRDPGHGLDHLGQRPVRDPLAVGKAAPREEGRALHAVNELAGHAALADAGLAVDGEEVRSAVPHGAREGVLEQLQLAVPASSSWARATPKAAITASPANFSTMPPWPSTKCDTSRKKRVTRRRTISGSCPETRAVESTRSTNTTVASFRSMPRLYQQVE